MLKLVVIKGPGEGTRFSVNPDGEVFIGRDPGSDIALHDHEVSRRHCRLLARGDRMIVSDLDSRNGIWLNGQRVRESALADGDELHLGRTVLRVEAPAAGKPPAPSAVSLDSADRTVLLTLDHREADILGGSSVSATTAEMLHEIDVLRELCRISQLAAAKRDETETVAVVLDRLQEALQADTVCLLSRATDDAAWTVTATASNTDRDAVVVSRTIANQAVREGHAILAADPMRDVRFEPSTSIVAQQIASALCSPLHIGGRFAGVLSVDRRTRGAVFGEMDLRLVASAANILALYLERQQFEREAERQARLAVIGEVIAGLAHYIKNVVTGFRLSIDALKAAVREQRMDYVKGFAESVSAQEARISDLMLNMLTYAKEREPERKPVGLEAVIRSVVDPYAVQFEKEGIGFDLQADPAAPAVCGDEMSLHRLFLNLIGNARDAVLSRSGDADRRIRVRIQRAPDGKRVHTGVYDTGKGMTPEQRARIFEAFFSTKGSAGTGLGLAVVKKIVDEHGGEISVDSREGAWTEFMVALPAVVDSKIAAAADPR